MPAIRIALTALAIAVTGCVSHGPGDIAYTTERSQSQPVGGTAGTGGGTLSGSGPSETKERRATPPVGTSRDGHGPAAGAIIDPTGAATRGRPY